MKTILLIIILIFSSFLYYLNQNEKTDLDIQYEVIKKISNIEIRQYKESLNASYYSEDLFERNDYFKKLAGYIFGDNEDTAKIQMTSPVTMKLHGNKEMIFRMPSKYTLEDLPKANNSRINFFMIPSCTKAAIQYAGYSNKEIEKQKIRELDKILKDNGIIHENKFELLVYNSPFQIINRRNEITVNIIYP